MMYVSIVNLSVCKSNNSLLLRKIYLYTTSTSVIIAPAEGFGRAIIMITIITIRSSKLEPLRLLP